MCVPQVMKLKLFERPLLCNLKLKMLKDGVNVAITLTVLEESPKIS